MVLLVALVATLVPVGIGVALELDRSPEAPAATGPASPSATPPVAPTITLADLDTRTTAVARTSFCAALPPAAVELALGDEPRRRMSYVDGEPAQLTREVSDIAHEFSCGWTVPGVTARAWVFAPPITRAAADDLAAAARRTKGCTVLPDATPFGRESAALACTTDRGVRASYRGLFGDAWLTCSLEARAPVAELARRADQWCAAVLTAASGTTGSTS